MCGEPIEPDLWEAVLTAGACWRAARVDLGRRAYWLRLAQRYHRRAAVLLAWDAKAWCAAEAEKPR